MKQRSGLVKLGALLIVSIVTIAWVRILFFPSRRPDVLPELVGCYESSPPVPGLLVRIDPRGQLVTSGSATAFDIAEDKTGLSLLPEKSVFVETEFGREVQLGTSRLLKLRLSDDLNSFDVPASRSRDVTFQRTTCSAARR